MKQENGQDEAATNAETKSREAKCQGSQDRNDNDDLHG